MMKRRKCLVIFLGFIIFCMCMIIRCFSKSLEIRKKASDDYKRTKWLLYIWLKKMIEGNRISDYLNRHGYKKIAIYGMGEIGKILLQDLKNTGLRAKYGIDRNAANISCDIPVYTVDQELEEVDLIIVTPFNHIDTIKSQLEKKSKAKIKAIDDILYNLG